MTNWYTVVRNQTCASNLKSLKFSDTEYISQGWLPSVTIPVAKRGEFLVGQLSFRGSSRIQTSSVS